MFNTSNVLSKVLSCPSFSLDLYGHSAVALVPFWCVVNGFPAPSTSPRYVSSAPYILISAAFLSSSNLSPSQPLNSASPFKPAATQLQWATISTLVLFLLLVSVTGSLLFPVVTTTILWALRDMVLFVDLEDESEPPELQGGNHWSMQENTGGLRVVSLGSSRSFGASIPSPAGGIVRENPNKNVLTEALGCYPIITSIASHIDLNTLDALSRTCRQIRVNLLQFRTQLLISTLHCENEDVELDPEHTFRYRARAADWYFIDAGRDNSGTGKAGDCARDMVGECRRCGRVVCRNCTIKPPARILLRHRHRRVCKSCSRAPLAALLSTSQSGPSPPVHEVPPKVAAPLSDETLKRSICLCPSEGVWLCQPCGRSLRSADSEYESIWKWRTRYLPSLGGLGVGIGEGNRGVPCGRGGDCLAAREVEQETDCDAEDARESDRESRAGTPSSSPGSANGSLMGSGREMMGPGYKRHEIEGIGGVVKKKMVKMVKVGACVPEWGEEKEMGKFLVREVDGRARSWCGWCWRVVPGVKDALE